MTPDEKRQKELSQIAAADVKMLSFGLDMIPPSIARNAFRDWIVPRFAELSMPAERVERTNGALEDARQAFERVGTDASAGYIQALEEAYAAQLAENAALRRQAAEADGEEFNGPI